MMSLKGAWGMQMSTASYLHCTYTFLIFANITVPKMLLFGFHCDLEKSFILRWSRTCMKRVTICAECLKSEGEVPGNASNSY